MNHTKVLIVLSLVLSGVLWALPAEAAKKRTAEIHIYDGAKATLQKSFLAFPEKVTSGANVAVGNTQGEAAGEIIVGSGPTQKPSVAVFNASGTELASFAPYPNSMRSGVKVASCDLDADGIDEIITGVGQGGGPYVRTLSGSGEAKFTPGFYAFDKNFLGGVNVACGDVTGDGQADINVGIGIGKAPLVRVFDRYGITMNLDFAPYAERDKGGVAVAVGNVDGGTESEIITSIFRFGRSLVKVYKANSKHTIVDSFEGWKEDIQGGFHVASGDLDRDNRDEVLVAVALGGGPHVRGFEGYGKALPQNFLAYEKNFRGGVNIAMGDLDGDGKEEIITAPGVYNIEGNPEYQKYIEVRIDEQRLYAYENGFLKKTFLVSTGIDKYPTPTGTFSVSAKIPKKDYEWSYGENHPDNYDIKDVQWNLRFAPTYYLHYAFWHNDFGRKRSHGCLNINKENSKWVYNWADVGTPVVVR